MGGTAPKIFSLDDYFMQETEKLVKDPLTKSEVKETVMVYEYEADLEPKYRNDLLKTLKKNIETGYYPFFIIDCVNDQVKYFDEMVTFATQRRFQVEKITKYLTKFIALETNRFFRGNIIDFLDK